MGGGHVHLKIKDSFKAKEMPQRQQSTDGNNITLLHQISLIENFYDDNFDGWYYIIHSVNDAAS